MKKSIGIGLGLLVIIFGVSCKKNDAPSIPVYNVPTTYSFTSESDSINVAKLLLMADQIGAAINLGSNGNTPVSATKLQSMFVNTGGYFTDSSTVPQSAATKQLNSSGLRLADYCPAAMIADINNYFDSIALYSQSAVVASHGVAGAAVSLSAKKYLLSPKGIFYSQIFKKAMNGMCAYEIANMIMSDSVNSTTDTAKLGHYWDKAFGFFGVVNNFPDAATIAVIKPKYMGSYCNQVNAGMNSNASIMNAFLKGRAAINNNDFVTMKAQARLLIATLDTLNAACVVQEMHETETNIAAGDTVASYGTMSESLGFVRNFLYNTKVRVITNAQIATLLTKYDATTPTNPDLYNFVNILKGQTPGASSNTEQIATYIGSIYGFGSTELLLL